MLRVYRAIHKPVELSVVQFYPSHLKEYEQLGIAIRQTPDGYELYNQDSLSWIGLFFKDWIAFDNSSAWPIRNGQMSEFYQIEDRLSLSLE